MHIAITSARGHAKAICGCGFQSVTYSGVSGAEEAADRHYDHTHHSWSYPKVVPFNDTSDSFPTMRESDRREMM